jgi:hypothetical protein
MLTVNSALMLRAAVTMTRGAVGACGSDQAVNVDTALGWR